MLRFRLVLMLLLLFALAACGGSSGLSPDKEVSKVKPMPINSKPYGKTYGEWSVLWWQWLFSVPASKCPLLDQTGEFATEGQSGKVWFLCGSFGNEEPWHRTVTIPPGTALFIDLASGEADNVGPRDLTPEQLLAEAKAYVDAVNVLYATLDGEPLSDNLYQYRSQAPGPFSLTVPDKTDNIWHFFGFDVVGSAWSEYTIFPCMADGYKLFLPPLSAGQHELHIKAGIEGYTGEVIYHITVGK